MIRMNTLYKAIMDKVHEKKFWFEINVQITREMSEKIFVIPPHRTRYLSEIAESNRNTTFQQLAAKNVAQNYMEFKH
jgi:methylmalonyl-CoA mutase